MRDVNLSAKYSFVAGDTTRKLDKMKNPSVTNVQTNLVPPRNNYGNLSPNPNPGTPNMKSSSLNNIMNNDPIMKDNVGQHSPGVRMNQGGVNSGFSNMGGGYNNFKTNLAMGSTSMVSSQLK
jgi:hypothetical protein